MADFLEERLPLDVRLGARWSDDYAVEITVTKSGAESRRLLAPWPVRDFTVHFTLATADLQARILALYHRAFGKYAGFRVRCQDDYSTNSFTGAPTAVDQPLAYISSGVYQLQKRYGLGATPLSMGLPLRTLYKPVAGTVLVAKNGVTLSTGVTVDTTTGRVTITPAPLITDTITGGCLFDLPCRFNSKIDIEAVTAGVREAGDIDLIELVSP